MKKQNLLLYLATLLVSTATHITAQQCDTAFVEKYDREAILIEGNTNHYSKNHEKKRIGIFGLKLRKEFAAASSESKEEYSRYCRKRKVGTVLMTTGAIALMSVTAVANAAIFPVFLFTLTTGVVTYSGGAICLNNSRKNLHKAVWLRNKEVLAKR